MNLRSFASVVVFVLLAPVLSGCVLVAAGGAVAGVSAARQERSFGNAIDDRVIKTKLDARLRQQSIRLFGIYTTVIEGRVLLDSLMAHATQRQFVYTHRWRLHDLVMWDNRCTMHRGTEFEEQRWKRDMQRATVSDIGNTCELVNRRAATSAV